MDPLGEAFTVAVVKALADPGPYQRGVAYSRERRVSAARATETGLEVTVQGTMPYVVELWVDDGEPCWSCTCPAAEDGSFCKHCVAVALTLDEDQRVDPSPAPLPAPVERLARVQALSRATVGSRRRDADQDPPPGSATDDAHLLADFVDGLPQDRLAEIVFEQATSDWRLRERLLAEARAGRREGPDLREWRHRINGAFAPYRGFVDYREARGWAEGVGEIVDALEDLCDAGHPGAAVLLAEHAHRRAGEAIEYVDDSDGWLSIISDRLFEVHLRASTESSPEPVALAGRLVELEIASDLEGFRRAAVAYAEVLGDAGLAAYREQLESRRRRIAGSADHSEQEVDSWALRDALVGWALATGDPDVLIDVHRKGGRIHSDSVLEIARSLAAAGRGDEAVEWARRGLAEAGDRPWQTRSLREYLAELLRERGQVAAAVDLFWAAFRSDPSLESYRRLLAEAGEEPGVPGGWARRCVAELRAQVAGQETDGEAAVRRVGLPAAAALAAVLLYEGRIDEAWSASLAFGCGREMWMTLARAREATHPLDAVDVYETQVLALIEMKKTPYYESAVDLMDRIRRLATEAGDPDRFAALLERVRTEHRAKRNLKKLLDGRGW